MTAPTTAADDRLAQGRELRKQVARSAHADAALPASRPDPVATLEASNEGRLPELVPIRFGRMVTSPFAFYRGSAAVMAWDLAQFPVTGLQVQACGDCHLMNFGLFATPERNVVFGLNDFDETYPGPWEWDVKRLAASIVVAGRDVRLKDSVSRGAAVAGVTAYRNAVRRHATLSPLDIWYEKITMDEVVAEAPDREARERRRRLLDKARERVGEHLVPKLVRAEGDQLRIVDQPPLLFHPQLDGNLDELAHQFLETYKQSLPGDRRVLFDRYRLHDTAIKVVGVGSVGTRCMVSLFSSASGHTLLLQVKEANASVLAPYVKGATVEHQGERVVIGQHLLQPASDIFLGWGTGPLGRHFYVRQLRDMKLSITLTRDAVQLERYAQYCGRALARAHANSGDPALLAGYLGGNASFDEAIGDFAVAYADQTERDHAALVQAVQDGRVEAVEETM